MKTIVSLRVDVDLWKQVIEIAGRKGVSATQFATMCIGIGIAVQKQNGNSLDSLTFAAASRDMTVEQVVAELIRKHSEASDA